MRAASLLLLAESLFGTPLQAQDFDTTHRKVYEKVSPSVVAVRAQAPLGERSGTGVVVSSDGLILTSYAVCPEGATRIRVWLKGPRLHWAELVGTSKKDEVALLRIKPKEELKPIEWGESSKAKVGQVAYTIGNAANSIILDDQPSFNTGIVSGAYKLADDKAGSWYTGHVIETTAAVNVGMEGAPLLDPSGKMIGFISLNYSPNRFLGVAIPAEVVKFTLERLKEQKSVEDPSTPPPVEGHIGLKVKEEGGKIVVEEVEKGGPSDKAGLRKGDVIVAVADTALKSEKDMEDRLKGLEAGAIVWFKVDIGGSVEPVKVVLEAKK